MAQLPGHPHIVGQYRAWQEGGHFYIQMDLCEGGNLHQLVAAVRHAVLRCACCRCEAPAVTHALPSRSALQAAAAS